MHDVLVHKAGNKLHPDRSRNKRDDAGDNAKNYDFHRQNILHPFRRGYILLDQVVPVRYLESMIDGITSQYVAMQQSQVQQDVSTSVLKSSVDAASRQGDNVEQLIQSAGAAAINATDSQIQQSLALTDPAMGRQIDLTV
jgi:streptomycin 6-kinase